MGAGRAGEVVVGAWSSPPDARTRSSSAPRREAVGDRPWEPERPTQGAGGGGVARLAHVSLPSQACGGSASARARLVVRWARAVPQMVIVGESSRQRDIERPWPVLELYEGPCFERLRARVGASLLHRLRVFVLTTRHGLVGANERLRPYEPARFGPDGLRAQVRKTLHPYLAVCPAEEVLLLMATHYLDLLPRVTGHTGLVHTIVDPVGDWPQVSALLDRWGWP